MAKYRNNLPQLKGDTFLTDGGLETTLIFHDGLELPEFAAFDLLKNDDGREQLYQYYSIYAAIARDHKVGLILESATWRVSSGWGKILCYSKEALVDMNHKAIELLQDIRTEYENEKSKMVIFNKPGWL
jgi:S-methylmethionine-dependent homocysteine/selenocysteine methylase